jgi:uncharacterized membrane protein required for colicin V production
VILVWVAVFAVHGFLRGSVAQVFVVLGLVVGLWAAFWVARWLEGHWRGAQPAWVYATLLWIVAAMAGMAAASLIQWWGERVGQAVRSSPVSWVDRAAGVGVGAAIGLLVAAFVLMTALLVPWPRTVAGQVARSRAVTPLMSEAAHACSVSSRFLPASGWLASRFRQAQDRAQRVRVREARRSHRS